MRALLCVKPGELEVVERPRPAPGPGEVLVRIRRAGVCGTDLHIYEGSHPFLEYPRVIGHELSGEIVETGAGCTIAVGQKVFLIPYLSCGDCVACRRGKTNCCQRIAVLGVHIDGGMADYVCVPEGNVAAADGLTLDQAAMVEFLAIGAHAIRRANPQKTDRILVVGAGPIGIGCMIFAKLRGGSVTALDMREDRLAFCRDTLKVDHTVAAGADTLETLSQLTGGDLFDIVIDASGKAAAMMAGFDYVAHGGTYVLVSVVLDAISFADPKFHAREMSLLGSRNATREDFLVVYKAMREGLVPCDALATHRASLEEVARPLSPMDQARNRRHQGAYRDLTSMAFPIIQFGTSRFLQAHVDLFVSEAMTKGDAIGRVVAVQTTTNEASRKRIAAFAEGKPYAVQIRGIADGRVIDEEVMVSSVGGGVDANEQWEEVERLFNEARCMVSNTADRGYETYASDAPDSRPPRSFPAKLAKLLIARHRAGAEPIVIFPCELTPANGDTLRGVVLKVLDGWNVPAPARRWIADDCVWVNSLVDRIVSQPLEPLGAVAEPYALWAIEDRPGLEVPCRHADVVVTNDLKRYERLKLFILNLGHTYLAEIWRRR